MERTNQDFPRKDNRTFEYSEANDRMTHMTDLEKCMNKLEREGYTDQLKVEKGRLVDLSNNKKYRPRDVKAVNFFRFEGISDPEDMSILYAIETSDGRRGTLVDAYGFYGDEDTGTFMREVEVNKKTGRPL